MITETKIIPPGQSERCQMKYTSDKLSSTKVRSQTGKSTGSNKLKSSPGVIRQHQTPTPRAALAMAPRSTAQGKGSSFTAIHASMETRISEANFILIQ